MPNTSVLARMMRRRPILSAIGPEDQRADHEAEKPRAEHRTEAAARQLPFLRDCGRDIADRLRVEAVDEQHRGADEQDLDLKGADRLTIDIGGNVDRT